MQQYTIIGGGIGGLYCAYQLIQKGIEGSNITIIEKEKRLGGCVQSWDKPYPGTIIEAGAGRFLSGHHKLLELIRAFGLQKTSPKNNGKEFVSTMTYEPDIDSLYQTLSEKKENEKERMQKMSFFSWASQYITTQDIRFLSFYSGYSKDFEELNAWNFMELYEDVFNFEYYGLEEGLSSIIERLEQECSKKGVMIEKGVEILDIQKIHGGYSLVPCESGGQKRYKTKTLVLALPRHSLRKFSLLKNDMNTSSLLKAVQKQPLMRIYAEVPGLSERVTKKVTTDGLLRYIIPIGGDVFMISYTDGRFADYWKEISDTGQMKERIEQCLERMFEEHYEVRNVNAYYWKDCVHLWKPGYDSEEVMKRIMNPMKGLWICSESYSNRQGWMEGSLEMVSDCINGIFYYNIP